MNQSHLSASNREGDQCNGTKMEQTQLLFLPKTTSHAKKDEYFS
jgi:hypothetical protein